MKYQRYVHRTGMLSVDYPVNWAVKEYPEDPRAKVEFRGPNDALVARIIAMPASGKKLPDLLPDWQERESQFLALGIKAEIMTTSVRGVDARVITRRSKVVKQKLILFVDVGLFCSFSFECSPKAWSRNQAVFSHLVENARLSPPPTLPAKTKHSQLLASLIRRAELGLDKGNYTVAHEAIQEGLEFDPENQHLLEIKSQIDHSQRGQDKTVYEKQQGARFFRLLFWCQLMTATLPFLGVVLVDSLQLSPWYVVPLLIFPFLDLYRQIRLWFAYLKTFGRPGFVAMQRMLKLDALRAYDPKQNDLSGRTERNLFGYALLSGLLILLSILLAWITAWYTPLYIASLCTMLLLKAIIRRSRPPAILLLGKSGSTVTLLHLALLDCAKPLEVVSLLCHTPTSWLIDSSLRFYNFRTASNINWQNVVAELVAICPIVVLDLRHSTDALQIEIELCQSDASPDRLFVVRNTPTPGPLAARTFDFASATHAVATYITELRTRRTHRSR